MRTGYYDEARTVALSSRASNQFAPLVNIFPYAKLLYMEQPKSLFGFWTAY
jgi:hypothetical protein